MGSFKTSPRVSFGVPVRNAESYLDRLLDSLLAQTFHDFEVVISDNASTDRTAEICGSYACRDARIRYFRNDVDLGQVENVNLVFNRSAGEFYRFIGADDWLEPNYLERCLAEFERYPNAIAISTDQDFIDDDGNQYFASYDGERVHSHLPHERFGRMLWFAMESYLYFDPIYSLIRRSALMSTNLCQFVPRTDGVLAAELSIVGPFRHVPGLLAHRRREHRPTQSDLQNVLRRYHPTRWQEFLPSSIKTSRSLAACVVSAQNMSLGQKVRAFRHVITYLGRSQYRALNKVCRDWLRDRLKAKKDLGPAKE